MGNFYVDTREYQGYHWNLSVIANDYCIQYGDYSSYVDCEENIAWSNQILINFGMEAHTKWEDTGALIGDPTAVWTDGTPATSAPRALGYGGWYSYAEYNNVYDWIPGAWATDLDSASMGWSIQGPSNGEQPFSVEALNHGGTVRSEQ